ncbi:type VI secretion system-associated FHA domain protein TagH [Pseudomonas sp. C 49-2]|uniref:type VI secretion system-associated FHA domain protein TagH n=1 Tax=Pseudomonas sp. C 49-2 TaxID=2496849 RepID=UPI000F83F715|nr:type VI secretion system-associated FHA domain protein TagH [Pseudomonas sp. C 49-2]RTX95180.1 type VI secretion system-associated FHA domain protein TagH [Pseudomonas sp. C 49-2]
MQLVFEVCSGVNNEPLARKAFDGVGGVIGRGTGCDWIIPDTHRLISSHHALVSYREGHYYLTDISSNGISVSGSMERLDKGQARLIIEGEVYQLGRLEIRARLVANERRSFAGDDVIPDDAFLGLDPVDALDREQMRVSSSAELDGLDTSTQVTFQSHIQGPVDRDHLIVPTWAEPDRKEIPPEPAMALPAASEVFWPQFAQALGVQVDTLDTPGREALAIKVAGLFKQVIEGLQQNLRTRDELNSEINIALTPPVSNILNPLKACADSQAAMASLLGAGAPGELGAEQAVAQACRDLQVHQVAMIVACRTAVRCALAAFAPGHLLLCFEREGKPPRFFTQAAYWRAYQRHYRRLVDEDPLGHQWSRNDFSSAYEEQVRLVSALNVGCPG